MANSLSFGGTDFSTYGAYLLNDFELPQQEPKLDTSEIVGRNGGYLLNSKYQIRDVKVPLILKGYADSAALYTAIDSLNALLDVSDGEQQLIFDYKPTRYLNAIASSKLQVKKISSVAATGSISFKVVDPFWYSTSETTLLSIIASSPAILNITPSGNVDTEPVFIVVGPPVGAGTLYGIENLTCNRSIWWAAPRDLALAEIVTYDSQLWMVKLNDVASMATIEHGSSFIVLAPGVSNTLRLTGFTGHYFYYAFRDRWL